jgi:primosomal protein N' (replication factor Y)
MKHKFAIIIPARRMARPAHGFDYAIPEALQSRIRPGDLVEIPFRSKAILGLVTQLKQKTLQPKERMKTIDRLHPDLPPFSTPFRTWLSWFSEYYGVSQSHGVLRSIPPIPKRQGWAQPLPLRIPPNPIRLSEKRAQEILRLAKKITVAKPYLLQWWNPTERHAFYFFLCRKTVQRSKQVLLLFPTEEEAQRFFSRLPPALQKISVLAGEAGKQVQFAQWKKITSGQTQIICGTRRALWFPFPSLGMVIVDDEQHEYHKQGDLNPRYHARTAALALAKITRIPCLLAAVVPSLEAQTLVSRKNQLHLWGDRRARMTLVSRLEEIRRGNYHPISEMLELKIIEAIQRQRHVFLFSNRTGLFHQLICRTCERPMECPQCRRPLLQSGDGSFQCPQCQRVQEPALACASCGGVDFSKRRKGLASLKKDLEKTFPHTPVLVLDRVRLTLHLQKPTILLGPTSLVPLLSDISPGCVGVIHAEQLLQSVHFRSGERMVQMLIGLQAMCDAASIPECVIQSTAPDHPLMQAILNRDIDGFYLREFAERKTFGFPPSGSIVKFLVKGSDLALAVQKAKQLFQTLQDRWIKHEPEIDLLPPTPTSKPTLYKDAVMVLLVRKKQGTIHIPWSHIPDDVLADVEPEHFY